MHWKDHVEKNRTCFDWASGHFWKLLLNFIFLQEIDALISGGFLTEANEEEVEDELEALLQDALEKQLPEAPKDVENPEVVLPDVPEAEPGIFLMQSGMIRFISCVWRESWWKNQIDSIHSLGHKPSSSCSRKILEKQNMPLLASNRNFYLIFWK